MKVVRTLSGLVVFAIGLTSLIGCKNTSGIIVNSNSLAGSSVIITENARLAHRVRVTQVNYDKVNGLQRVHLTIASDRNKRLRVDYRICWFDANGMELDSQTKTYRNLILEGHDAVTVTGVANSPAAVSSKLRVRETSQAE